MRIGSHEEYQAKVHRAAALSDALSDSEQGAGVPAAGFRNPRVG